ncbi:hypothetical protein [Rhodoplanes sp. SY1]|uniref:hypothetical protein n=1 Tax=Rhodoplanes sp. SY1 TaxID=3166646 RepID=UPI0038B41DD7
MPQACALESWTRSRSDGSASNRSLTTIVQTQEPQQKSLIERMERALLLLAYFIEIDGDVHVPMYEKFEAELDELRRKEDVKERARRLLAAYSREGGVKAIDNKNLSLSSSGGPLPYLGLPVR